MKTHRNQTGRPSPFSFRRSPASILLKKSLFLILLLPGAACLVAGCTGLSPDDDGDVPVVVQPADSCRFTVRFRMLSGIADTVSRVSRADVFIYSADGLKELEGSRSWNFLPDSLVFSGPVGDKTVVAVLNSPRDFNLDALQRYDSIELLTCPFDEDSPSRPLMSGLCNVSPDGSSTLSVTPLMARVKLGEISNGLKNYVRLEDPRIYLENISTDAEILRTGGFRPSGMIDMPGKVSLPYDIGIFPQTPGTELFCYPNDSPESIGTPLTNFVLECEIKGETKTFTVPINSIRRNSTTYVDISVTDENTFESKVY